MCAWSRRSRLGPDHERIVIAQHTHILMYVTLITAFGTNLTHSPFRYGSSIWNDPISCKRESVGVIIHV